jgi:hypothetical protein
MTDARTARPAITRGNLLRLGGAAIPAAALLVRDTIPAEAARPAPRQTPAADPQAPVPERPVGPRRDPHLAPSGRRAPPGLGYRRITVS